MTYLTYNIQYSIYEKTYSLNKVLNRALYKVIITLFPWGAPFLGEAAQILKSQAHRALCAVPKALLPHRTHDALRQGLRATKHQTQRAQIPLTATARGAPQGHRGAIQLPYIGPYLLPL